jgi:TPP-dependent pyruvate/acetoin dehydrogenase alpha subunit
MIQNPKEGVSKSLPKVEHHEDLVQSDDELREMLRKMLEIRIFEERVEKLFHQGKTLRPVHTYLGHEAIGVGVISALGPEDKVISTYRGHGHALARGVPPSAVMGEILGKSTGTCKGLGGSMHAALSVKHGILMATAIVGSGIPIAAGVGLGLQLKKKNNVVAVFFGDGAVSTGAFHEGLNLAAVWKLPVLFVCENNLYGQFTPQRLTFAGQSIAERAKGYGIRSEEAFGNDVVTVNSTARDAIEYIKGDNGPAFIEYKTYRTGGHAIFDVAAYRPKEEVEEWKRKDPVELYASWLKKAGMLTDEALGTLREQIKTEVDEAERDALDAPVMPFSQLADLVYA